MGENGKWRAREWRGTPEEVIPLPAKRVMSSRQRLEAIIRETLGGPRGDPDQHHWIAAAHAYLLLRESGEPADADLESDLRQGNPWEEDFIDLAERDAAL